MSVNRPHLVGGSADALQLAPIPPPVVREALPPQLQVLVQSRKVPGNIFRALLELRHEPLAAAAELGFKIEKRRNRVLDWVSGAESRLLA